MHVLARIDIMTANTTVKLLPGQSVGNPGLELGLAYNALFFPSTSFEDPNSAMVQIQDVRWSLPEAALRPALMNGSKDLSTHFEVQIPYVYVRSCEASYTDCISLTFPAALSILPLILYTECISSTHRSITLLCSTGFANFRARCTSADQADTCSACVSLPSVLSISVM